MNAIPAKVAGVKELIMVVPTPDGEKNALVLAAAAVCGVDRVFCIGGAQAVGALAYGTQTVPQVDKIVGPGNAYVAAAKRRVFGIVGIDMVAGPLGDTDHLRWAGPILTGSPWICSRRPNMMNWHKPFLLSPNAEFLDRVEASINKLVNDMPRQQIIKTSLQDRGALIQVRDLNEAADIANYISPEHLELSVADPVAMSKQIRHAGAIFMGRQSCEAVGDYLRRSLTMCYRLQEPRAFLRRWACTTFRSVPA